MTMKILALCAAALTTAGCLPWRAQNTVIVDGEASLEFPPDKFVLSGSIRSRAGTQQEALRTISQSLAQIRDTLPQLEGLTHLTIEASEVVLRPIQNRDCLENAPYGHQDMCPVEGTFGSIHLSVKASPATLSGQTLSLLSELGAESVSIDAFGLNDEEAAREAVLAAAVENARGNAAKIAEASGAALGAPAKIQYGGGFPEGNRQYYEMRQDRADVITVTASRTVRPEIGLDIEPQPIRIDAKVVAAFAIE